MISLTRRRDPNSYEEGWLIFYGDVPNDRPTRPEPINGSGDAASIPAASPVTPPMGPRPISMRLERLVSVSFEAIGLADMDNHIYAAHMEPKAATAPQ